MAKKHLFLSFFLTAMLCIVGVGNAWGANRSYSCAITSCSVTQSNTYEKTTFTVTFGIKAKNRAEYNNSTTYTSTLQLVLESIDDRTLEGTYTVNNVDDMINTDQSSSGTYLKSGSNYRYITGTNSTVTIEKVGTNQYRLISGEIHVIQGSDYYNYYLCYPEATLNTQGIAPTTYDFSFTPSTRSTYNYKCAITSCSITQTNSSTKTTFKLTFGVTGKNTAEYNNSTTYPSTFQLVLESTDRTLEGTYTNNDEDNKINEIRSSTTGTWLKLNSSSTNYRYINRQSTSTIVIEKVGENRYSLNSGDIHVTQSIHYYNYSLCYPTATINTNGIDPTTYEFNYTVIPYCPAPSNLECTAQTTTTATFSWDSESGDTWKYVCLPASTTINSSHWTNAASTNSTSVTVSGLDAGTSYKFYVRLDCGSSNSSAINVSFNTECVSIAQASLPWSENFDDCASGLTPACWTQLKTSSGFAQATSLEYRGSDGNSLRIAGGTSSSTGLAVFPQFADDIKNLELTFYYRSDIDEYGETYGQAQIGYITNIANISTFVAVQTLDKAGYWTKVDKFMVPANTPDGAYFAIRFYGNGNTLGFAHIDDIVVSAKPECVKPTNVAVSGITNEGATIGWDDNDMTAWVLQVSEGDDEHWGEDINADSDSKALTGLNDNTLYYVRVKADCGVYGDSDWSDAISFRTECDAIDVDASTPWFENFNAMSEEIVPECWNNSASTATPYWGESYFIWGTYDVSGNKMLCMSNASVDGGIALINTPTFTIPDDGKEYEFMFDYANHASSDLIVKMSVDGSAFGVVNTYHNTGSNSVSPGELTSETISLYGHNGSTVKLQFYTTPASGYYSTDGAMFVDNVGVRKVPSCFQPTALAASSITANSAHIAWTAGASETSWKLQYRESGDEWSEEITVNTTAAKDLESLSANTTYEVRVKAWCNTDDFSEWSEVAEFTTLCAAESMPYSEAFGLTTTLPTCWKASSDNWSGDFQSTNGFARLRTGSSGTASLCTPPVDLSEDAILRFKWKNANGTAVNLYISTDRGETKTLISEELSDEQADWATKQYNLSAYTGEEAQFYFIATFSTLNQYAYLDDVEVFAIPTEVFEDVASATNNQTRLAALMGQTLNITINRPLLRNGDYCTLTLPFNLSAAQIADENCPLHGFTIKEFEKSENSTGSVDIYLNEVSAIVAGKAYFVRYAGTPTNERLSPLYFRNVTVAAYEPASIALSDDCTPHGVFNPYALTGGDQTTLFLSSNNTLYYPSADGTMNGFRAYLKVDAGGALSAPIRRGAPIRIVEQENTATGLESIQPSAISIQKVIRDGQLIIIRDGKEYNAQGMHLQ